MGLAVVLAQMLVAQYVPLEEVGAQSLLGAVRETVHGTGRKDLARSSDITTKAPTAKGSTGSGRAA